MGRPDALVLAIVEADETPEGALNVHRHQQHRQDILRLQQSALRLGQVAHQAVDAFARSEGAFPVRQRIGIGQILQRRIVDLRRHPSRRPFKPLADQPFSAHGIGVVGKDVDAVGGYGLSQRRQCGVDSVFPGQRGQKLRRGRGHSLEQQVAAAQILFSLAPVGDIATRPHQTDDLVVSVEERHFGRSIPPDAARADLHRLLHCHDRRLTVQHLQFLAAILLRQVGRMKVEVRFADDTGWVAEAELVEQAAVDQDEAALPVFGVDRVGDHVDYGAQPPPFSRQIFFDALAGADIFLDRQVVGDGALLVAHRRDGDILPVETPVAPHAGRLAPPDLAGAHRGAERLLDCRPHALALQVAQFLADGFRAAVAGGGHKTRIDVLDHPACVGDHHGDRALLDGLRQLAQPLLGDAALGDVAVGDALAAMLAVGVDQRAAAVGDPAHRAIGPHDAKLDVGHFGVAVGGGERSRRAQARRRGRQRAR
jgi:hypothetical protein